MQIKFTVGNQRGGVGKTTTALTLARCFAERGLKTLLVDADPQGSIATILKLKHEHYLYDFLFEKLHLRECVVPAHENIDVLLGGRTTTEAEQRAAGVFGKERLFEDTFSNYDHSYDVVIIDVSPSITLMQACAMVYTRYVLVPVAMDTLSVSGAGSMLLTAQTIGRAVRAQVTPIALLPTIVNKRYGITEVVMSMVEQLSSTYHIPILQQIRTDTTVNKAMRAHSFLTDLDPHSKALEDYEQAAQQILDLMQKQELRREEASA